MEIEIYHVFMVSFWGTGLITVSVFTVGNIQFVPYGINWVLLSERSKM